MVECIVVVFVECFVRGRDVIVNDILLEFFWLVVVVGFV